MDYDVNSLTLEEKLQLLIGRNFWQLSTANGKLPDVFLADGPHGLRKVVDDSNCAIPVTAMPNFSTIANTWNPEMAKLSGETIADDCIENNVDVLLAPGVNIKRTPLCGRNFEYFSEDPYLAGAMAKSFIEGVQSKGVGTSLKHFCANNSEYDRVYQSSDVDERTLREIYLPAFETAVKANPYTVMCSYNPIAGIYASENKWLLKDVLRDEFGFNGLIVSDWRAVPCGYKAIKATLDLTMPYDKDAYKELKEAYEKGFITIEEIDERVKSVLEFINRITSNKSKRVITTTKETRHDNAVKIACEGMTLLKNEDGILPLKNGNIYVDGKYCINPVIGGGGSALATSDYKIEPLSTLLQPMIPNANVTSRTCAVAVTNLNVVGAKYSYEKISTADTVVLCVGTGPEVETEGRDRTTLRLSKVQEDFIIQSARYNKNIVVVLYAGSAVDASPWIDKVKAVLLAGFSGEGVQEAVSLILSGKVNPSGKLSETYPLSVCDTFNTRDCGNGMYENYFEKVLVGYRYYDTLDKDVLFPFGYGLSYSTFEYSNLKIKKISQTDYELAFKIKNTSAVDGSEVAQVYVKDVMSMVLRPEKELKGFCKVNIKAGETKTVKIKLDYRSFAYYSIPLKKWYVENGDFEILVGSSSRNVLLKDKIKIELDEAEQYSQINMKTL